MTLGPNSVEVGEVRAFGDRAFIVGAADAAAARSLAHALTGALGAGVDDGACEVIGGLASVVVRAADVHLADALGPVVHQVAQAYAGAAETGEDAGTLHTIPCAFDGPDLDDVATAAGCTPAEVVAHCTAQPLRVAMLGFSPGFAFLDGLPEVLRRLPRRDRPRPAVPAGSLALANGHAAVYPSASPGGWHLIGRTDVPLFSPLAAPYARLRAGDTVRFTAVEGDQVRAVAPWSVPAWPRSLKMRHLFTVLTPGLRTVLQDGGRQGGASMGVPAAGPADPHAFALANRLVGNGVERAALEIMGQGPTLRADSSGYVTVVGASPQVRLDGQYVVEGRVVPVHPGQELVIGAVRPGLRSYLAAAGGFAGPRLLGSVATDQLCGLGPGALAPGDSLWVESMIPPLADHLDHLDWALGGPVRLRVLAGPHPAWFVPDALARLTAGPFVVSGESNRVGVRLRGAAEAGSLRSPDAAGRELDSQAMVHGAVQVPPDGDPVVLLPDHATHGGYPVVAVVIAADLGRLGQCAPGDTVTFELVDPDAAREARATQRRVFERAVVGYYPLAVE